MGDDAITQIIDGSSETSLLLDKSDRDQGVFQSKWRPFLQLLFLSTIYMFVYSPLVTLMNLETILNPEIGIYALMCNNGGAICALVTAPIIAHHIGAKGSVLLGCVSQAVFIAAHFYVEPYILLPVAFIVGLGHAQTWITNAVFVTDLALQYSHITKRPQSEVMGLFQGIFWTIYNLCGVSGNLVSSLALIGPAAGDNSTTPARVLSKNVSQLCGRNFCPWEDTSGTLITIPEQEVVYIILGCFLVMVGVAFFLTLFFVRDVKATTGDSLHSYGDFIKTMGHLIWKKKLFLMLPPFMIMAFGQVIILTEFIKAFVSCEIGIEYNGWSAMFYSGGQVLGAAFTARVLNHVGLVAMFILAACCNLACLVSMLLYEASGLASMEFYFLIPFAWALVDSIWLTGSFAYVGHVFPNQKWPVFVTVRSAIYTTYFVAYGYSNFICMDGKVYIALGFVALTLFCSLLFLFISKRWHKDDE